MQAKLPFRREIQMTNPSATQLKCSTSRHYSLAKSCHSRRNPVSRGVYGFSRHDRGDMSAPTVDGLVGHCHRLPEISSPWLLWQLCEIRGIDHKVARLGLRHLDPFPIVAAAAVPAVLNTASVLNEAKLSYDHDLQSYHVFVSRRCTVHRTIYKLANTPWIL